MSIHPLITDVCVTLFERSARRLRAATAMNCNGIDVVTCASAQQDVQNIFHTHSVILSAAKDLMAIANAMSVEAP
jgi:hypothetical protein